MRPFDYVAARDPAEAIAAIAARLPSDVRSCDEATRARFIAGGTNVVDLMKEDVLQPSALVHVGKLALTGIDALPDGGLMLGAAARNADTAAHPLVRERWPLLRAALLAGASPQIRNMATNGGNLLQRTRCVYFHDIATPCNKREPGSGCPARDGLAQQLAILGTSEHCIATHPSDFCVALAALDAVVHVRSPRGDRAIAFADLHRLPGDRPDLDTTLTPDELVLHLVLPPNRYGAHVSYLKVRERRSYAFALVSVAAALELDDDGRVREARVALGGVAAKPWRDVSAERLLLGERPGPLAFAAVADALLRDAHGHGARHARNDHKIPLARRAVVRALGMARDRVLTNTGEDAARARDRARRLDAEAAT